jgi:hypothetical protein
MPENATGDRTLWYPKYFFSGFVLSIPTIYFFGNHDRADYIVRTTSISIIGLMALIAYLLQKIGIIDIDDPQYKAKKPLGIRIMSKFMMLVFGHGLGFSTIYFFLQCIGYI